MKQKLLNVTDLSMYLYCPRKFYLEKIKGVPKVVSKEMIEGRIRHEVLEGFSKKEEAIVESIPVIEQDKIVSIYNQLLTSLINQIFAKNRNQILSFKINPDGLQTKILAGMNKDVLLRANSISEGIKAGFSGKKLWENLKPKYLSEFEVISENLGLKGRIDRVMISEEIVPFELKTREVERVFDSDKIQVAAYVMLLEEKFQKPIRMGILESGNIKHEIMITDELRNQVLGIIDEIRNITSNPKFPGNFAKCQKCSYQQMCDELK